MEKVKRYRHTWDWKDLQEDEYGEFILYEEYEKLLTKYNELVEYCDQ